MKIDERTDEQGSQSKRVGEGQRDCGGADDVAGDAVIYQAHDKEAHDGPE